MRYNFDMDGTIADLYGINDWCNRLQREDATPYAEARPLVNMARLARALNRVQRNGHEIAVISWTSRNCSVDYSHAIARAKREWLARHLPSVHWDAVAIIPYGTPKSHFGTGVLFDDEERNRTEWGEGAYPPSEIFTALARG